MKQFSAVYLIVCIEIVVFHYACTCSNGDIRLVDGTNTMEGRVEICYRGVWGTVCDDFWGTPDANVVCRQLGFRETGATPLHLSHFGQGTGSIFLDNVHCTGCEERLIDCRANAITVHNCIHHEDAGVRCLEIENISMVCTDGDLRLTGGSSSHEGYVEICQNGTWGTVCANFWTNVEANVKFNLSITVPTTLSTTSFILSCRPMIFGQVTCSGNETQLANCTAHAIGQHNCSSSTELAGLGCRVCDDGAVRLRGGANELEGRVEVCHNGVWGTVCDDFWGSVDANVVCRQLGFSSAGAVALSRAFFGQGTGSIFLDNVQCTGCEGRLIDCRANAITVHNCVHSKDAGVRCLELETICPNGDIRLQGGADNHEGRVELCHSGVWGTVCSDSWGSDDANVVCRQLGFRDIGATTLNTASYVQSCGPIFLDEVTCFGNETRLVDCTSRPIGDHDCTHIQDVGLRCPCDDGDVRLQGGRNQQEGRVELCHNGVWGTVCDDFWGNVDANVVCRQLGFSGTGAVALLRAFFGQGTGSIFLDNVQCRGCEGRLIDCRANAITVHNCGHSEDAGVRCLELTNMCSNGDIRLQEGASHIEGRIEICHNRTWGTVCADSWGISEANVACRELGLNSSTTPATLSFALGCGGLDQITCLGGEARLVDCGVNSIGRHNCSSSGDAGVKCLLCDDGDIRLQDGANEYEGRVEICHSGLWGTVCDDFWGYRDASVVCRQLGFSDQGATALRLAYFGLGTGSIFLDNVQCTGCEGRLIDCRANAITVHNCIHLEDAGVRCMELGTTCSDGDIRLQGGARHYEGRVEICHNGVWGTVCDDSWGSDDANVVCRQLGFRDTSSIFLGKAFFGRGSGSIFLDDVACSGSEERLVDCSAQCSLQHNCVHYEDASVICLPLVSQIFLPFGLDVGDNETNITDITSVGPFNLNIPIVYYLRKELEFYITTDGVISFDRDIQQSEISSPSLMTPMIAPLWTTTATPSNTSLWSPINNQSRAILYHRITEDQSTLDRVKQMIVDENHDQELSSFEPKLAAVITWHNALVEQQESFQAVLSTDGTVSFAVFIYSNFQAVKSSTSEDELIGFDAGDGLRNTIFQPQTQPRRKSLRPINIYRIDGNCIISISPNATCDLKSYAFGCESSSDCLSPWACRCQDTSMDSISDDMCDVGANFTCVTGSNILTCPKDEGRDNSTHNVGCYSTMLPCYLSEHCSNSSEDFEAVNCTNDGFISFGEGSGDNIGPLENDSNTNVINLRIPVVFYTRNETSLFISTNGIISFRKNLTDHLPTDFPRHVTPTPIIAPLWVDFDFTVAGSIYYRVTSDQNVLAEVAEMIVNLNPALDHYQPVQALIVTWFEARLHADSSGQTETLQMVLSTDGSVSFAAFTYYNLTSVNNFSRNFRVGFDAGNRFDGVVVMGGTRKSSLERINIFRIDGECVTSILPGKVCPLEAVATRCDANLTATACECDPGFQHHGSSCIDVNECDQDDNMCDDEHGNCTNTHGSFNCACMYGFTGDGFRCTDLDECALGLCGNNSNCFNTLGSFHCVCRNGYIKQGSHCIFPTEAVVPVSPSSSSGVAPGVAVSVVILVVLTVVILLVIFILHRRHKRKIHYRASLSRERSEIEGNEYFSRLRQMSVYSSFNLQVSKELIIHSCNLQLGKTIGQGEFGIVYKGLLKKGFNEGFSETVAVKTLKGFLEKELVKDLLRECAKMKEFNHPNILELRGVCLDGGPAPYIIMPFMTNGSLLSHLKDNRASLVLDPSSTDQDDLVDVQKKLTDMCIQVAKGMEYLASKRVIHRDLATRNCMIDSGFVIKVADFGLSESMDITKEYFRQDQTNAIKLPIKWLAPESIADGIFSEKTDVWAFGVTCWEVFSGGKTPYSGIHPLDLFRQLEMGYRMEKPLNSACSQEVYSLVRHCWEGPPELRPTFSEIVGKFSELLGSMADYFALDFNATMTSHDDSTSTTQF